MIVSTLINDKQIAEFDEEITEKFEMQPCSAQEIYNERMQIGVRNSQNEIYRAIGVTGMDDFLEIVQFLADIGLVDELKTATSARHGFDAIFSA